MKPGDYISLARQIGRHLPGITRRKKHGSNRAPEHHPARPATPPAPAFCTISPPVNSQKRDYTLHPEDPVDISRSIALNEDVLINISSPALFLTAKAGMDVCETYGYPRHLLMTSHYFALIAKRLSRHERKLYSASRLDIRPHPELQKDYRTGQTQAWIFAHRKVEQENLSDDPAIRIFVLGFSDINPATGKLDWVRSNLYTRNEIAELAATAGEHTSIDKATLDLAAKLGPHWLQLNSRRPLPENRAQTICPPAI